VDLSPPGGRHVGGRLYDSRLNGFLKELQFKIICRECSSISSSSSLWSLLASRATSSANSSNTAADTSYGRSTAKTGSPWMNISSSAPAWPPTANLQ
jgi:hypothetical protein